MLRLYAASRHGRHKCTVPGGTPACTRGQAPSRQQPAQAARLMVVAAALGTTANRSPAPQRPVPVKDPLQSGLGL